ncbi:hypothetical protein AAFF_G00389950 [Aldrovandia affinis]|uniref:Uncharacterized protein n=1 Tax=Aldrovandia affinis TaxID=143900 RepID=A0AAD7WLD4_9TELE|nr:hypothetical protein AAFF_G00389950 [Aldrovandia affinis]
MNVIRATQILECGQLRTLLQAPAGNEGTRDGSDRVGRAPVSVTPQPETVNSDALMGRRFRRAAKESGRFSVCSFFLSPSSQSDRASPSAAGHGLCGGASVNGGVGQDRGD